ncbi:copper-binding protein [Novosphingobium subterraneum]|uniref:copper-binding protein n=1 Tax=Novosphingobium subterraneum TaxID=48936 RepID=UPI0010F6E1E1
MKKFLMIASSLALLASLAACKKAAEAPKPAETATAGSMANMPMAQETKRGTGEGKIVSLNAETGAISIEHGPITGLGWPGMTMGFMAKPDLLKGLAKGDKVSFAIVWDGKTGTVTKIEKSGS